ncbi:barstar family protein [Marinilongibacter aquaticus]|uniref:barstar family protein n=1 Tax=Marinilongibacter aquaticus TaxID=2975157 RepID=UPI0021BDAC76|nr:barstar family protein [Marinilongibacter aquaticus]UBM57455.1 barstar family protein [Marinilongibacter aquaticus]
MNNLFLTDSPEELDDYALIEINSKSCKTLRSFYEALAQKLHFPDYFAFNMDSFDEIMNDLSWIEDERLLLYFSHSEEFLINERNDQKVVKLLEMLDATCEDWKFMDEEAEMETVAEEDGEVEDDYFIPKKELIIGFSNTERMEGFLQELF